MRHPDDWAEDEPRGLRHSGFGIASFLIAIGAGLLEFALVAAAAVLEASTPGGIDEDSPAAILLGLGIFGGLFVALVGIGLGVAGLCQQNRSKVFAVLGVVFGSAVLLGVLLLLVIGSLMP